MASLLMDTLSQHTFMLSEEVELLSSDKDEIKKLKRNPNLSSVDKGVYNFDKEPTGLSLTEKDVMGIDPGVRSLKPSYSPEYFSISNKHKAYGVALNGLESSS